MEPNHYGIIYVITNKTSKHQYVGQTTQGLSERWYEHKRVANKGHLKTCLCNAMRSYGNDTFEISLLDYAESREELDDLERHYIKLFNTITPNGYNLTTGGFGFKHIEETKKKISGILLSMYANGFNPNLGVPLTEEHKNNIAKAKLGVPLSEEHIENKQIATQRFYDDLRADPVAYEDYVAPRRELAKDILHTPEVEKRSREGKIGTHPVYSEGRNKKISNTLRLQGHKPSEECSRLASEARRGTHHTEESKLKMSEALKGRVAHNKYILTPEQEALVRELLNNKVSVRNISIALFGSYKKTMIYRIVKDLISTPSQIIID